MKEIGLAKNLYDIYNEYNFITISDNKVQTIDQYLIKILIDQDNDVIKVLLKFIEKDFIRNFQFSYSQAYKDSNIPYLKRFLIMLVGLENYDLLIKVLDLLIDNNKRLKTPLLILLPRIKKSIEQNNVDLLVKYIDIINLILDRKVYFETNYMYNINELIEEAEK